MPFKGTFTERTGRASQTATIDLRHAIWRPVGRDVEPDQIDFGERLSKFRPPITCCRMSSLTLVLKNLGRNPMRTILTMLGTMVLVSAAIMIWSILLFLERVTTDSGQGVKVIVHERWSVSGRMPFAYAETLSKGAANGPDDVRPLESMTWQVYAGTLDALKPTRDNTIFAIALEAEKMPTMLEGVEGLPPPNVATVSEFAGRLVATRDGMILGLNRQRALGARVGDRIKLHGISECRGIDLDR